MSKTSELLELGEYFDRMGVTTEDFDRQTFVNRMNAVSKVNPSQAGVNRALYATIASLQQQLAAKGAGGGGSSGAAGNRKANENGLQHFYLHFTRNFQHISH